MKTRLLIIGIISVLVFGLIYTNSAHAIPFISPEFSYENAKYVIVGKVLSVEILSEPYVQKNDNIYNERFGFALYEIQIEEYLKNPIDNSTMKLLGTYTNQRQTMSYETYPYEINQRVLLYIQEIDSIPGYDLIVSAANSRVIDNGLCDSGSYFEKGLCVIIDDSTNTPDPPCKSGPMPDGEGWVFIDCNWKQYADVLVESCQKEKAPANNYAWNSQDCLWEWSPGRNENSSGPAQSLSAQEEKPSVILTDDEICGSGNKLVDGVCINPNVGHFDAGLNQILLFVSIGVIIFIVSFIIWRKRK